MATIRQAVVGDAAEVAVVHVAVWQAAYAGTMPAAFLAGLSVRRREESWRRVFEERGPDPAVLVAETDEGIVGFAVGGPSRADDAAPGTGELYAINLLPGQWGAGLGRTLHDRILAALTATGYRQATLWVLDTNARARRFYEREGWAPDGATQRDEFDGAVLDEVRYRIDLGG